MVGGGCRMLHAYLGGCDAAGCDVYFNDGLGGGTGMRLGCKAGSGEGERERVQMTRG